MVCPPHARTKEWLEDHLGFSNYENTPLKEFRATMKFSATLKKKTTLVQSCSIFVSCCNLFLAIMKFQQLWISRFQIVFGNYESPATMNFSFSARFRQLWNFSNYEFILHDFQLFILHDIHQIRIDHSWFSATMKFQRLWNNCCMSVSMTHSKSHSTFTSIFLHSFIMNNSVLRSLFVIHMFFRPIIVLFLWYDVTKPKY